MGNAGTPTRLHEVLIRRPAVAAAALFMLGIAVHARLPEAPWTWLALAAVATGMATLAHALQGHRDTLATIALATAMTLAGAAAAQIDAFRYPDNHISAFATDEQRLAMLRLRLDHPPRMVVPPAGPLRSLPPKQVATANVTEVRTWNGWRPCNGELLVQIAEPHPRLAVGQTIEAVGMLQRPAPAMNPGQFDWAGYYRQQRILASFHIAEAGGLRIIDTAAPGPIARLRGSARRLLAAGFAPEQSLDHALLRALLLGDNDPELRDVQEQFKRTGTSHHLSISGMHVAVLGGFIYLLCRLLRVPPRATAISMLVFVIVYGLAALPSPPVVRSVLLCAAFAVGLVSRRSLDAVQLLALSVLVMLVYHPLDLFNAGFQLSFGTVLALILFTPPFLEFLGNARDQDVVLARQLSPPSSTLARWWTSGDWSLLRVFAAACVAWFASMPLIAFHFEQLNPWAVLGGIVLAPVVLLALVGGLLKVVLTLLWPAMAEPWAALAAGPIEAMRWMVDVLALLPGSQIPLPAPPLWLMVLFYLVLLATLLPKPTPFMKWGSRLAPVASGAAILWLPFHTQLTELRPDPGELRVTLLAVGAGQCAVVEPPSGRTMLIDAGSASLPDLTYKCLAPYLRRRGRTQIDTIIVSHANYDHFGAVAEVAEAYDVREVLTSTSFRAHASGNPPAEAMLAALDRLERPPRVVAPGESLPLGRDTAIDILWPPRAKPLEANDASLVFRLRHAGASILFTGDIQDEAMRRLLAEPSLVRAEVLIAPHHGSAEPSTADFIIAVAPKLIVSSNDRTLTQKQHAFDRIAARLPVHRTHRCGAVTIIIDSAGAVRTETFLPAPQQ
jgi:competence protein ComEC